MKSVKGKIVVKLFTNLRTNFLYLRCIGISREIDNLFFFFEKVILISKIPLKYGFRVFIIYLIEFFE